MESITRRSFLKRGGTGVAAAGILVAVPSFPKLASVSPRPATVHSDGVAAPVGRPATGPLVVHIPDPRSGEVHMMVGTREVVTRDSVKDCWNTQAPAGDAAFSGYYDHPSLATLLNVLYPGAFPNLAAHTGSPSNTRPDLDAVLLTGVPAGPIAGFQNDTGTIEADMLRLNVAIEPAVPANAAILGVVGGDVAGFPNGRRVFDDVVSIELKAVTRALLGDVVKWFKPDAAAGALYGFGGTAPEPANVASLSAFGLSYRDAFPYLGDSWDLYDNPRRRTSRLPGEVMTRAGVGRSRCDGS